MKKFLNEKNIKLKKPDYIIISIIVIIYSILSFYNLGDIKAPQTYYEMIENEMITIELKKPEDIIKIRYYEMQNSSSYQIYVSNDNEEFKNPIISNSNGSFSWTETKILKDAKYIRLASADKSSLGEIALYGNDNKIITIKKITSNDKEIYGLTDEQKFIPKKLSYLNSTYFDEIFYARTAYEYINNLNKYDWFTPPLGKLIIAIPIKISNTMAPFYYRLMGNLAGIIMIPLMYLLAKELFKKRKYSIFAALLIILDNFHFVESRISSINIYLALFIMFAFYFIFRFINGKNQTISLLLSGLFLGLAISVKWTGLFAIIPLTIIILTDLIKNKKINIALSTELLVFLIVLPITIYLSSFYIFPKLINTNYNYNNIIEQHKEMINYNRLSKVENNSVTKWYQLPLFIKPVWYYTNEIDTTHTQTIVNLGNIAIYWFSIVALIYLIIKVFKKKEETSIHLLIIYLGLFIPNIIINNLFQYDYLLLMPYVLLIIVNLFRDLEEKNKTDYIIPIYLIIVLIVFMVYFPVSSGRNISNEYTENIKILNTWYW